MMEASRGFVSLFFIIMNFWYTLANKDLFTRSTVSRKFWFGILNFLIVMGILLNKFLAVFFPT